MNNKKALSLIGESFNLFIHADDVHRAVRVSEITGSNNATEIQKLMTKKDNKRHNYYHHYTKKKWGDGRNYHLAINIFGGYDMTQKEITVLMVEPGKYPKVTTLKDDLDSLQTYATS